MKFSCPMLIILIAAAVTAGGALAQQFWETLGARTTIPELAHQP